MPTTTSRCLACGGQLEFEDYLQADPTPTLWDTLDEALIVELWRCVECDLIIPDV